MVHPVGVKIREMPQPGGRKDLEQKTFHDLLRDRHGRQAHVIETIPDRRGIVVPCAMVNIKFHSGLSGSTSTETLTTCLPPPVKMPATGLTSPKSRPSATVMCSSPGRTSLVGSKSTQPVPGQKTENQAWLASAPTSRGLPAGGRV